MVQRPGNHGIVIPQDPKLLAGLYWIDGLMMTEIAAIYDVTHKSVCRAFRKFGIPTRAKAARRRSKCCLCSDPVKTIKHAVHGYAYGKRCEKHHREHMAALAWKYTQKPEIKAKKLQHNYRSYYRGPKKPKDEKQWLSRNKVILRNVKRACNAPKTLRASLSPNAVSKLVQTSLL